MPFLLTCTSKKCGQQTNAYLDPETNEVYCADCGEVITNVSIFTKRQMAHMKQVKPKEKKSFSIKCEHCGKEDRPKIVDDNIVCALCGKTMDNLSPFFKNMLKTQLKEIKE
jgi:transcription initiation factor TFIIIB Brf1 subunit/transcription initiation factor TFIIB